MPGFPVKTIKRRKNKMTDKQVPNLGIDAKNKIITETKKVPLKVNGEEQFIILKKLSTQERNKVRSECTQTKIIAGQPSIKINDSEIQEKILVASIVEAPFEHDLMGIRNLPAEVSDYLFNEHNEFAEPTDKKKD